MDEQGQAVRDTVILVRLLEKALEANLYYADYLKETGMVGRIPEFYFSETGRMKAENESYQRSIERLKNA